jgi:hypothetical protein
MILLFLGSVRSTLVVVTSIPLSILVSIIALAALGETLNTMTLGGMALAVGILVDDATVEIENIHRNLGQKKKLVQAILDGAQQIAVPAFVSTLSICIVFVPVAFITGAAKSLFVPLALAVAFAMLTSYFLSRTLVPTMVKVLLRREVALYGGDPEEGGAPPAHGLAWRGHEAFNVRFERLRVAYGRALAYSLAHRPAVFVGFGLLVASAFGLAPFTGKVTRLAKAIDATTRTMLVEAQIPNHDGAVPPGAHAEVHLAIGQEAGSLTIPAAALLFTPGGAEVATIGPGNRVHRKLVQLGTDLGLEVEVVSGLDGDERLVANASGGLVEGVHVVASAPAGK